MVLAPHQFSQLRKPSSKTSLTTSTEISTSDTLTLALSSEQVTKHSIQASDNVIDGLAPSEHINEFSPNIHNETTKSRLNSPELASSLIVRKAGILEIPKAQKTISNEHKGDVGQTRKEDFENLRCRVNWLTLFIILFGILLVFSYLLYGSDYFFLDNKCTTIGLRMNWKEGPPPM